MKTPKTKAMSDQLKKALLKKPTPIFMALVASRDQFWRVLNRRYLRARSRADKSRLMRDTGTTAQSYFAEQKDGARPWAAVDSKYKVARIHEDTSKPRVMNIEPRVGGAKALFIPTVLRPVSKGILPKSSSAAIPGSGTGNFVFRNFARVTRRWPSKHALDKWGASVIKVGHLTFEQEVERRWEDGPPWPQETVKRG